MTAVACCSGAFGAAGIAEATERIAAAGFDGVELSEAHVAALGDGASWDRGALVVVGARFGAVDAGDRDGLLALRRRATELEAELATVLAAAPADGAWPRAAQASAEALVAANFAGAGPVALELPAAGSLIDDAAAYDAFWPLTTRGRAPLAFDVPAATAAGINPNQVWRALAARVALLRVDEELIASEALTPWLRMAAAYAYPGAWVVRPAASGPSEQDLDGLRRHLLTRLAAASRG